MPAPTRSAPAAFGRGVALVAANPGLLLAPLVFGGAVTAVFVAAGAGVLLLARSAISSSAAAFRRGPAAFPDLFEGLRDLVLASPGVVLLALLAVLVALLLLPVLAAWLRAGVTGSLAEIDALAGADAPLQALRHPALGAAFFASASRLFGRFFALVNLYALVASFVVLLIVLPLVGALAAVAAGRSGLVVLFAVLFAVLVLVAIVLSIAMRVVYLVAGRVLAVEELDALASTARAISLVRESLGRSLTLYFLTVGGAMAVGLAFVFPRMVLTIAAGSLEAGVWAPVLVSGAFVLLQIAAGLAYDLAVTGAFVALWPVEAPAGGASGAAGTPEPPTP